VTGHVMPGARDLVVTSHGRCKAFSTTDRRRHLGIQVTHTRVLALHQAASLLQYTGRVTSTSSRYFLYFTLGPYTPPPRKNGPLLLADLVSFRRQLKAFLLQSDCGQQDTQTDECCVMRWFFVLKIAAFETYFSDRTAGMSAGELEHGSAG